MATSLLRLGRLGSLKCLRVDSWAVPRTRPAALFCTQTQEPVKPAKKTKAAGKTADAPDDRAALLAYKTAVAFPVRLSEPGAFLAQPAGVPDAVVSSTAAASSQPAADPDVAQVIADTAPPVVDAALPAVGPLVEAISATPVPAAAATNAAATEVAATEDAVPAAAASSEPGDAGADGTSSSSSSNSDSDSDSDSDSEDEKSEVKPETKSSTAEPALKEEAVQEGMGDTNEGQKEPEASLLSGPEVVQEAAAAPAVSPEELVDSAPEIRSGPEVTDPHVPADAASEVIENAAPPSVPDAREDTAAEVLAKAATPEQTLADSPVETTEPAGDKAAEDALAEAAPEPAEAAPEPTEAAPEPTEAAPEPAEAAPEAPAAPPEAAAELCAPVDSTEELVDSAPVVAEAAGEELQMEAPAEPSEEAAAAPPEPEEPFDNSTYKNQQHHSYTPYTFADLDLEMAKFRLPQPSSGRPSPQH